MKQGSDERDARVYRPRGNVVAWQAALSILKMPEHFAGFDPHGDAMKTIDTALLRVAYEEWNSDAARAVVLLHGVARQPALLG